MIDICYDNAHTKTMQSDIEKIAWVEMHGDIWDLGWIPNLVSHPVLPDVDLRIQAKTSNRIHAESQQHHPVKKPVTEPILNKTVH